MKRGRVVYEGTVHAVTEFKGAVRLPDGRLLAEDAVLWLAPLSPGTIFAIGLNFLDHAKELSFKKPEEPMVFFKGPNTLTGHRGKTMRPEGVDFMHYECELAVVIGTGGRNIPREKAMDHVAGYTVANDYAFRNFLRNYYRPNLKVKSRDSALPLGPWLVDAVDVPDPMNLRVQTFVNGERTQDGSTSGMIFDVAFLVSYLSDILTLRPGDVILTGTPDGVVDVKPGDVVVTEIESVGRLQSTITDSGEYPLTLCEHR